MSFVPGQRWISETQPEMGLGLILKTEDGTVTLVFPASNETRTYAAASAPLRRVTFSVGDTIELQSGDNIVVTEVEEAGGLLTYVGKDGAETAESALGDLMGFHQPDARLLGGRVNSARKFRLRRRTLEGRSDMRGRAERGLVGARIDLVPHQMFIASEVAKRHAPRVLLADEVGLGKTIEACLIVHRQIVTGRAARVLVLVPEPLVHQWFIELMRRFNLKFAIYDEERCASIEAGGSDPDSEAPPAEDINPFLDDQAILASVDLLAENPTRAAQAAAAGWDILVVDEAHHLEWAPEKISPEYQVVENLAALVPGLLLLTATPGQLRPEGHFARLRLLDPERFSDLGEFLKEQSDAADVSAIAHRLETGEKLTKKQTGELEKWLGGDVPEDSKAVVKKLLDLHGTGRVMFRNRRANLGGFPEREAKLYPLPAGEDGADPRVGWLIELLEELGEAKVLLICKTQELAEELHAAIEAKVRVKTALFHEGLDLIQRDRNAAYFSEEDGARLLLCSEIGSEGRNFQFAHHLVLFDLPDSPPLLEQRIGRLDRIGQTETIKIHVPFAEASEHGAMARWFHEGLDAFEHAGAGGTKLLQQFHGQMDSTKPSDTKAWDAIIAATKEAKAALDAELDAGRDRLTEMSSYDAGAAAAVVGQVKIADQDHSLENLLVDLFDQFGVAVEPLSEHTYYIKPDSVFSADAFPGMREIGMSITFDRAVAMANETMAFVTWDHPIVTSSIDLLLTSEIGSTSFGQIPGTAAEAGVIIECLFVFEAIAPPALGADRFLPPTTVHAVVDHHGKDITSSLDSIKVKDGDRNWLNSKLEVLRRMVPPMIDSAEKVAGRDAKALRKRAEKQMESYTGEGIDRLERLAKLGHPVRPEEIAAAEKEREDLRATLAKSRLRLDSVRLIVVGG